MDDHVEVLNDNKSRRGSDKQKSRSLIGICESLKEIHVINRAMKEERDDSCFACILTLQAFWLNSFPPALIGFSLVWDFKSGILYTAKKGVC